MGTRGGRSMRSMALSSSRTETVAGVLGAAGLACLLTGLWWLCPAVSLIVAGVLLLIGASRVVNGDQP